MQQNEGQAKTRVDIKENILYISLSGKIKTKQLEKIYTDIRFGVADLQPGFSVITDLSEVTLGHLSSIGTFKKITSYLNSKQVGQVIRIIGEKSLLLKQILRITAGLGQYSPRYVNTMTEAKTMLDELRQQKK